MIKLAEYKVVNRAKPDKEIIDYGVQMLGAPLEWPETMGQGIRVGIIDTGVDLNHEDLQGRVKGYINFTSSDTSAVNDDNGHGTHVAGIIAANKNGIGVVGAAPGCDLYIAKAFSKDGSATQESIQRSLRWLIDQNVHVINMSFSSDKPNDLERRLIWEGIQKGITFVSAAGNEGGTGMENTIGFPAKYKEVIAVTAVDVDGQRASFSSQGAEAQIAAAGTDILSTYMNNSYVTLSGTSMATPLITGAVAILQSKAKIRLNRYLTPAEVQLVMDIYADDLGNFGKDIEYGYGLFSFGRYLG